MVEEEAEEIIEIRHKPRPKFLVSEIEYFAHFKIKPESDIVGNQSATVRQNLIREIKLRFPIVLKENSNLIGAFGYRHEQFKFSNTTDPEYPFFYRFDDKSLKRITFRLFWKKDLARERFFFSYLNSSFNSDRPAFGFLHKQLKLSVAGIYGKKLSEFKLIGGGVSFGYDFGEPAIFPMFMLNNDFSENWGYELLLPKSAQLRYSPNGKNHFFGTLDVQGASYYLQDSVFAGYNELEFRRSSVRLSTTYEREIHDWLWVGITGGYRYPINIFISEPRERRSDAIMVINANPTFYFNFSIFMVPPRALLDRGIGD